MRSMIRLAVMALALQIAPTVMGLAAASEKAEPAIPLSSETRASEALFAPSVAVPSGWAQQTDRVPAAASSSVAAAPAQDRLDALAEAAGQFRVRGQSNFADAVKRHATASGAAAFARINKAVWAGVDSQVPWSHFMLVSVAALAVGDGGNFLAAFYNPWSDVFLITQWRREAKGLRIADAEILLGDWVRKRGVAPLTATPLWLRGGRHLPAAPAIAAADSIRAFETAFARWNGKDWRARLGGFANSRMLAENLLLASNAMGLAVDNSIEFSADTARGETLLLRNALGRLLKPLIAGDVATAVASAAETTSATKTVLAQLSGEDYGRLLPIAAFLDLDAASVYLVPAAAPEYLIAIKFDRGGDGFTPRRIDFVSYQATYEWRQANSPDPERGERR